MKGKGKVGNKVILAILALLIIPAMIVAIFINAIIDFICGVTLVKVMCNGLNWGGVSDAEYIKIHHSGGKPIYNKDIMVLVYGEEGILTAIEGVNKGEIKHSNDQFKAEFTEKGFQFPYERVVKMVPVLNKTSVMRKNEELPENKLVDQCVVNIIKKEDVEKTEEQIKNPRDFCINKHRKSTEEVITGENVSSNTEVKVGVVNNNGSGDDMFDRLRGVDLNTVHPEFKNCLMGNRMEWFIKYGKQFGVDPILLAVMCSLESGGNSNVVSGAGARGIMQFMHSTGTAPEKSYDFSTGAMATPLVFNYADFVNDEKSIEKAARLMNEYGNQVYHDVAITLAGYNVGIYGYRETLGGKAAVKKIANTDNLEAKLVTGAAQRYLAKVAKFTPPGYELFMMDREKNLHFMNSAELRGFTGTNAIAAGSASVAGAERPDFTVYNYDKLYIDKEQEFTICDKQALAKDCLPKVYFSSDYIDEIITGKAKPIELFVGMKNFWNEPFNIKTSDIENYLSDVTLEQAKEFLKERELNDDIHVEDLYKTDIEMLVRKIVASNEKVISHGGKSVEIAIAGTLHRLHVALNNKENDYKKEEQSDLIKMRGEAQFLVGDYDNDIYVAQELLANYLSENRRDSILAMSESQVKGIIMELFSKDAMGDYTSFLNDMALEGVLVPAYVYAAGLDSYPSYKSLNSKDVKNVYEKYVKENELDEALINAYIVGKYFERNAVEDYMRKHSSMFTLIIKNNNKIKSQFKDEIANIKEMIDRNNANEDIQAEGDDDVINKRMRNALAEDMFVKFALYNKNTDVMNIGEFVKLGCVMVENHSSQGCIDYNVVSLPEYKLGLKSTNIFTHTRMNVTYTNICVPDKEDVVEDPNGDLIKDENGELKGIGEILQGLAKDVVRYVYVKIVWNPENKMHITGAELGKDGLVSNIKQDLQKVKGIFTNGFDFFQRTFSGFKGFWEDVDLVEMNPNVYEKNEIEGIKRSISIKSELSGDIYAKPKDNTAIKYAFTEMYKSNMKADEKTIVDKLLRDVLEKAEDEFGRDVIRDGSRTKMTYNGVAVGYFSVSGGIHSGELAIPYLNRVVYFSYDLNDCASNETKDTTGVVSISLDNATGEKMISTLEKISLGYGTAKIENYDFKEDLKVFYRTDTNVNSVLDTKFVEQFDKYMMAESTNYKLDPLTSGDSNASDVAANLDGFEIRMPFIGGIFTSGFGERSCINCSSYHRGYDIVTPDKEKRIYPMVEGVIARINNELNSDRGKFITIVSTNGEGQKIFTLYQHLASIPSQLQVGQAVTYNTVIGIQGGSGKAINAYASHLHFEFSNTPVGRETMNIDELLSTLTSQGSATCTPTGANLKGKVCK